MKFPRWSARGALVVLSLVCGLLGFGLVVLGLWLVYPPVALVVAGLVLVAYAWRVDRAVSCLPPGRNGEG